MKEFIVLLSLAPLVISIPTYQGGIADKNPGKPFSFGPAPRLKPNPAILPARPRPFPPRSPTLPQPPQSPPPSPPTISLPARPRPFPPRGPVPPRHPNQPQPPQSSIPFPPDSPTPPRFPSNPPSPMPLTVPPPPSPRDPNPRDPTPRSPSLPPAQPSSPPFQAPPPFPPPGFPPARSLLPRGINYYPSEPGGMQLAYSRYGKPLDLKIDPVKVRPVKITPMKPMKPMRPVTVPKMRPMEGVKIAPFKPVDVHIKNIKNRIYVPDAQSALDFDYRPMGAILNKHESAEFHTGYRNRADVHDPLIEKPKTKKAEPPEKEVIQEGDGMPGGAGGLGGGFGGFEGDVTGFGKARNQRRKNQLGPLLEEKASVEGAKKKGVGKRRGPGEQEGLKGVVPSDLNRMEGPNGAGYLGRGEDWEDW